MKNIIIKYLTDRLTDSEMFQLLEWLKEPENLKEFQAYLKENYNLNFIYNDIKEEAALLKVKKAIQNQEKPVRKFYWRYAAAAVVIVFLVSSFFFRDQLFNTSKNTTTPIIVNNNIKVGTDKAILTLEDNSEVALIKGNTYKTQNVKSNGEKIIYDNRERNSSELVYNYLTIPRGGQFFIKLSDGTQVWLNSESKLKYPVDFIEGKTREVELVYGEAYFDVSPSTDHNGSKFKVLTNTQEIEVLGTEFNIKNYKNETNIYTTLIEGKVAVIVEENKQNLVPNEQSILNLDSNTITMKKVDVYNEISWKDGVFSFEDKPLKDIMKVLARWYDTDVVFINKEIENKKFTGILDKEQSVEKILSIIYSSNNLKYEINNKTIIFK